MKVISLNIWGGKLFDALMDFLHQYSSRVDFFCLQEVLNSPVKRILSGQMRSNIFAEISLCLNSFQGYFAPCLKGRDLEKKVDFPLGFGNAIFVKKNINLISERMVFVYKKGFSLVKGNLKTIPRNLQYVKFEKDKSRFFLGHFHGVWYPKSKLDNPGRIEQSKKIIKILNQNRNCKRILCGDFNLQPETKSLAILEKGMRNLIKEFNIDTTRNYLYDHKEKYADYFLVSPEVKILSFKVIDTLVSDHLPLVLEFE